MTGTHKARDEAEQAAGPFGEAGSLSHVKALTH